MFAEVKPAWQNNSGRITERPAGGTLAAAISHMVTMPYHPDVTTKSRLTWTDPLGSTHTANVLGVENTDGRCVQLVLVVSEVVT